MDTTTFNKFRTIIYEQSGISLKENKKALVCARVAKRMRKLGIQDYRQYLQHITDDESGEENVFLLDAISTNVTSFYREPQHFEFIQDIMSKWLDEGQRRFRFWSSACSTGEEPYTLAMTLLDTVNGHGNVDMRILATDISTRVLEICREAKYTQEKVKTVPGQFKARHFSRTRDQDGQVFYTANSALKDLVLFRRLNLSTPPFPMRGPLDIVLCRNVMIYFDNEMRKKLLTDIYRLLKPGGYLMVGHAESLTGMVSDFKVVKPSIYIKK